MRSLGIRLALWYSLALAVLLVLLGGFLYLALDRYLTGQALTLLRAQAQPLQELARQQRGTTDSRALIAQIAERPAATGVGVYVVGPTGGILSQSILAEQQRLPADAVQKLRAAASGKPEDSGTVTVAGQRFLLLYRPLALTPRNGAVVLATSLAPVDATLHDFLLMLGIGIGTTLSTAALIVIVITRLGLRPLRHMAVTSRHIAEGDLSQRVDDRRASSEVGELAQALNYMAGRLQTSFQAQRQFAADASHELRTPLTALAGYLDVLLRGAKDDPALLPRVLTAMRAEVDRMSRLVRDLVALARLDAGDQLQLERVDLAKLAADVYEQAKAIAPARRIGLQAADGAWVEVDVDRMRQVLLNLADNAIKYTPPDARIDIAVQHWDSTVQVAVSDDGPGISHEDQAHLWDRFYRAEQSRTRERGGAGLGLAIVKKIVEAHRGTISLTTSPGQGASFAVQLPLAT